MGLDIYFENSKITTVESNSVHAEYFHLRCLVSNLTNVSQHDLFATQNGRPFTEGDVAKSDSPVRFVSRLCGGKGGFGSMLRAIGAQIEKTTNREACRDLSGRRLRDIREEQRLREWAASKPQRTEDAARRKEDRLKRLCAIPSHEFQDAQYEEARRRLEEDGGSAVDAGALARPCKSTAAATATAPASGAKPKAKKRKPNLWIDEDLSDMSSSESGCEEDAESPSSSGSVTSSPGKGKGLGKRSHTETSSSTCTAFGPDTTRAAANARDSAYKGISTLTVSETKGTDSGNESDIKTI